jgi:hypothetical protein
MPASLYCQLLLLRLQPSKIRFSATTFLDSGLICHGVVLHPKIHNSSFGVIAAIPVLLVGSAFSIILALWVNCLRLQRLCMAAIQYFGCNWGLGKILHKILIQVIILKICFSISMKPEISGEKGERVQRKIIRKRLSDSFIFLYSEK